MNSILYRTESSHYYYIWISFLLALIVLGLDAVALSFIISLEILEFHIKIPWTMMISAYIFFVVSSTGLCIVTSLGHVFGRKDYEMIGKRGVFLAIITIVFGMAAIFFHLGHPERASFYVWATPNIGSAIWGMGFFYTFYIVFIFIEYWLLARVELAKTANAAKGLKQLIYHGLVFGLRDESHESVQRDHKWAKYVGVAALVAGLSAHSTLGAVFGHAEARPIWYGAYYPVYFLLSAAFSGLAWLIAVLIVTYRVQKKEMSPKLKDLILEMSNMFSILLSVGLLFMTYKVVSGLIDPVKAKSVQLLLNGPFSISFWIFEIGIGMVIPIGLTLYALKKQWFGGLLTASVMVLIGLFFMRYDFVVSGQIYPVFSENALPPTIIPTIMEFFVIGGVFGGFFLAYTLAVRYLPIEEEIH